MHAALNFHQLCLRSCYGALGHNFTSVNLGRRLAQLNQAVRAFDPIAGVGVLPHLEMPEVVIGLLQQYFRSLPSRR